MRTVNLTETTSEERNFVQEIAQNAGVNLRDCYQCGKCSAGCPMAEAMDLPPQQIMRLLQMGKVDQVLQAESPWICAQCNTCSARCPQKVDTAAVMREVRRASHEKGHHKLHDSNVFETLFIKGIKAKGKSNEQYLAAQYNITSGHFIQDAFNAPKMFQKNMIGVSIQQSENPAAIKAIIEKCQEQKPYDKQQLPEGDDLND